MFSCMSFVVVESESGDASQRTCLNAVESLVRRELAPVWMPQCNTLAQPVNLELKNA